jgi:hypothetical protein
VDHTEPLVTETTSFTAFYSLSNTSTITATVTNGIWLPY